MDHSVTAPWSEDAGVLDLSDTDLEAKRTVNTRVSDPDRQLQRLIGTLVSDTEIHQSKIIDRCLRVALADALDSHETTFTRSTFDVAYSVPPSGWLFRQRFPKRTILNRSQLPNSIDSESRGLSYSTSTVVHNMAKRAVDEDASETISALVICGAKLMCGRQEPTQIK